NGDRRLLEAAVSLEAWEPSPHCGTGRLPGRLGSAHRNAAPYQAIRCRDGYITVGASNQRLWQRFCHALGLESLLNNPRFADNPARKRHEAELIAHVEGITLEEPSDVILARLERAGVPAGRIFNVAQALANEQVEARGLVVEVDHPTAGSVRQVAS